MDGTKPRRPMACRVAGGAASAPEAGAEFRRGGGAPGGGGSSSSSSSSSGGAKAVSTAAVVRELRVRGTRGDRWKSAAWRWWRKGGCAERRGAERWRPLPGSQEQGCQGSTCW